MRIEAASAGLEPDERNVARVVAVLCDAFADYPVMRFVLGEEGRYEERLATLIGMFVGARVLRGEPLLGIGGGAELDGVAVVSRPDRPAPPAVAALREAAWAQLGEGARARYEAYTTNAPAMAPDLAHVHLNMLGVRRAAQRTGVARQLLAQVHRVSREDPESAGVSLNTEDPANVAFYERFGYRIFGHARVAPGLDSWGFFRPD